MSLRTALTAITGEELSQINQSARKDELPSVMTLSAIAGTVIRRHTFGFKSFAIFSLYGRVQTTIKGHCQRAGLRMPGTGKTHALGALGHRLVQELPRLQARPGPAPLEPRFPPHLAQQLQSRGRPLQGPHPIQLLQLRGRESCQNASLQT